jgi:CelD/BcsL family acetyltransferase involved in cellulose biosynthesis
VSLDVDIVRGLPARALLADERFVQQWASLWSECPWATAFQTPGFARAWDETYSAQFEPVLVMSRNADGLLRGLLVLGYDASDNGLVVAGRYQAEYHAWICRESIRDTFAVDAIRVIQREFPGSALTFRYLPRGVPTGWMNDPSVARLCLLQSHRRPLLRFGDGSEIERSLGKGSNKSRLRRLEKVGAVRFRRITDAREFEAIFDDIIRLYDFRHGAVHGSDPFASAGRQKEFHVAMMKVPGLLHVTVLEVAGQLASAHFGAVGKGEVHLGTIVHDPGLAKHSPGKFLILFLSRMLMQEGHHQFDLTPGGDAYKERFANAWDEAQTLTVLPSAAARRKAQCKEQVKAVVKRALARRSMTPSQAKEAVARLAWRAPRIPTRLLRRGWRWMRSSDELRLYAQQRGGDAETVSADPIAELLMYCATPASDSRQKFLSEALTRIEDGDQAVTLAADGRLKIVGWLTDRLDDGGACGAPAGAIHLCDIKMLDELNQAECKAFLLRARQKLALVGRPRQLVVEIPGQCSALTAAAEGLGLIHCLTIRRSTRFGRVQVVTQQQNAPPSQVLQGHHPTLCRDRFVDQRNVMHCSSTQRTDAQEIINVQ